MNTCVCGLAFGDEGKGKVVDIFSDHHDYVVRYNGGANAGHTVVVGGQKYKSHLLPVGVIRGKTVILASGMAINPVQLAEEIQLYGRREIGLSSIFISNKAHCVMPWHIAADIKKGGKIGTTKRGIGPCYADKMHRWNAIRMGELQTKLADEKLHRFFAADEQLNGSALWEQYNKAARFLAPHIVDTGKMLREIVKKGKVLFESANGIHLDIDHGTYPYVTSSAVGPAGIPQSCELPNFKLDEIVGVMKCYTTRVGEGPFPSEIEDEKLAHEIREAGQEYGTTTGRPRRIGWLDLDLTARAVELTGATSIALMHIDTMLKIGVANAWSRGRVDTFPFKNAKDISRFMRHIEDAVGIPIKYSSNGPGREDWAEL